MHEKMVCVGTGTYYQNNYPQPELFYTLLALAPII